MHADAAFRMGCTHSVCQDYAVALRATAAGGPAILLADGCSSSPDTDVGARLLARATARVLESVATLAPRTLPEAQRSGVERAHRAAADLGLPAGALDATLLVLAAGDGVWWASLWGDGLLAWENRHGEIHVRSVEFPGGCPDYPIYSLETERLAQLRARPDSSACIERHRLDRTGTWQSEGWEMRPAGSGPFVEHGVLTECRWIALFSDGIRSFARATESPTSRSTAPVPFQEPLQELVRFRSGTGVFVQRRLQRFAREADRRGWTHRDDLALAALWLGDAPTGPEGCFE